jgi:choice-of-anchor B domain-containing protein
MHRTAAATLVAALAAAPLAAAQPPSANVTLLGRFEPIETCSDIWGYHDPATGKEYAFLLSYTGTYVLDCTDPASPVERAFIPGPNSLWRAARTLGHYLYVITEGGGGMQIVDLADPANPQLVRTWGADLWTNAHTLNMDVGTGHAYVCGANNGMHVIDVRTDPEEPILVTSFSQFYVHDGSIQDGFAHLADVFNNRYRIMDVRALPTTAIIASVVAPGPIFFHSAWVTRDNQYTIGVNETAAGPISIWDVRIKTVPLLVATMHPAPLAAISHNPFEKDRVVHCAYYTDGYKVIDLSDPPNPKLVGFYDTHEKHATGYHGAWGCYPYQPSGVVYVSDVEAGLFTFRVKAAAVRHGPATAGGSGKTPEIWAFGATYVGNSNFKLQVEKAKPSSPGVLILNVARGSLNLRGVTLNVDIVGGSPAFFDLVTSTAGAATVALPVPNDATLSGRVFNAQFLVADAGGPLDLSASRGLELQFFTLPPP